MSNSTPSAPDTTLAKKIPWAEIEKDVSSGMTFVEASTKYTTADLVVTANTIGKRAKRHGWVTPKHIRAATTKAIQATVGKTVAKVATDWATRGEELREVTFKKASESIKKFKPKAPKNFRELESAAKVARQAAGLDTADIAGVTLIQINERMENMDDEQPIEATDAEFERVPDDSEAESPSDEPEQAADGQPSDSAGDE